jgi:adenine specific DNA methylase Mod
MLYEGLVPIRELLSDRGSLFLHLAPNVSHLARTLLDEIFGAENFRAEIIWKRTTAHGDTHDFGAVHDSILCFAKSSNHQKHSGILTGAYGADYLHRLREEWPA